MFNRGIIPIEQLTLHAHHVNILLGHKLVENILFFENPSNSPRLSDCRGEIDGSVLTYEYQSNHWDEVRLINLPWPMFKKKYVSPTIIISYSGFDHDCALICCNGNE